MRRKKKSYCGAVSRLPSTWYLKPPTNAGHRAMWSASPAPWEEQGSGLLLGDLDVRGRQAPAEPAGGDWELGSTTLEQP